MSFALQKLLCLIRSNLFIFAFFFPFVSGDRLKNIAMIYGKECSPVFSLSFMVSSLTFRTLTYYYLYRLI